MGFKQFLTSNWRLVNSNNLFINRLKLFKLIFYRILQLFHEIIRFVFIIRCANSVLESSNTGYAQKAVVNKLELPPKPKKPSPPFFQFLQEKRPEVAEKYNLNSKGMNNFPVKICI